MRKKIIAATIVILLFVGISIGCTENKKSDQGESSNLNYNNNQYNFGLNKPEGWTIKENEQSFVVLFNGPTTDAVNIGISQPAPLSTGETLNSVVQQVLSYYSTVLTNLTIISNNTRVINGMDAHELVISNNMSNIFVKQKQVFIENNGIVYTITYTALLNTYDKYISVADECVNSFTITS